MLRFIIGNRVWLFHGSYPPFLQAEGVWYGLLSCLNI